MLLSIVAVVMAAVAFVATRGNGDDTVAVPTTPITATPSPTAPPAVAPTVSATPTAAPVDRNKVHVVIFNNTAISGLAGTASERAQKIGWDVVGADNWHGSVPKTTVYYPPRLKAAAKQLALDLGIKRTAVAQKPMSGSRVTVILTGPLD